MRRFNTNNFRLFLKLLVTAWVPVAIQLGVFDSLTLEQATGLMAASTLTIDALFRVFNVGDAV